MGFFRTAALMIVGWVAIKMMKRAIENLEAQQVKAKAKPEKHVKDMPRLKLDPITGVYVPEA
jgi:hypothetical protein